MKRLMIVPFFLFLALAALSTPALAQGGLNPALSPNYATITLSESSASGTYENVQSGGSVDVAGISPQCRGFASVAPDLNVMVNSRNFTRLILEFDSYVYAGDTTMIVRAPDGRWHCNDDRGSQDRNPRVVIENVVTGLHSVWIGSFNESDNYVGTFTANGSVSFSATISVGTAQVQAGGNVQVSWGITNLSGNCVIRIYNDHNQATDTWFPVNAASGSTTVAAPEEPGQYQFRLFRNDNLVSSSSYFTVTANPSQWIVGGRVTVRRGTEVRTGSGLRYPVQKTLNRTQAATVVDGPRYYDNYTWWDVYFQDGSTGWILQYQADGQGPVPADTSPSENLRGFPNPPSGSYALVFVSNLRIRSGPGPGYNILGYAVRNTYYPVLEINGDWGKVRTLNETIGWISLSPEYVTYTHR